MTVFREICARAERFSPFLRGAMARQSSIVSVTSSDGFEAGLDKSLIKGAALAHGDPRRE